jgi:hypothetical protein
MRLVNVDAMREMILVALGTVLASPSLSIVAAQEREAAQCQPTGLIVQLPELSEASGLAVSRRTPDRLWTHNDSVPALTPTPPVSCVIRIHSFGIR